MEPRRSPAPLEALIQQIARELDTGEAAGLILTGSHVRGDATPYSDVDFDLYFHSLPVPNHAHLSYRDGYLISVIGATVEETRAALQTPSEAIFAVPGLRSARILFERDGLLSDLQQRAREFDWEPLQAAADREAERRLVKLAEAVHKVLGCLFTGDVSGTVYNTNWLNRGLTDAVAIQRGVMVPTMNAYYRCVQESVGVDTSWARLHRQALGMEGNAVASDRALAALRLYAATAVLLRSALSPAASATVTEAVQILERFIAREIKDGGGSAGPGESVP